MSLDTKEPQTIWLDTMFPREGFTMDGKRIQSNANVTEEIIDEFECDSFENIEWNFNMDFESLRRSHIERRLWEHQWY